MKHEHYRSIPDHRFPRHVHGDRSRGGLAHVQALRAVQPAFTALGQQIAAGTFTPAGPAFARYDAPPTDTATLEIGFPVEEPIKEEVQSGEFFIRNSSLPEGRLAISKHHGSYDLLPQAWEDFLAQITDAGHTYGAPSWEAYDTMPTPDMDPADLVTGLAIPVQEAPQS